MKEKHSPTLLQLRDAAIEAAEAAGHELSKRFKKALKISEKKNAGLVTDADLAAEAAAMRVLKRKAPHFGFLTEESAPEPSAVPSEGRWICDPLDGTTNFVHGFPMFCVSIAAEWRDETVVGVIHHPILKETYVAVRGKGAFLNGKRIQVSKTQRIRDSLLTTGFTYRKTDWLRTEIRVFEKMSGMARAVRRPGSAALDLAYTASGVFDGFWERGLADWDMAAGALLVSEAGGKVTHFDGSPFSLGHKEIVATNGIIHRSLRKAIEPVC